MRVLHITAAGERGGVETVLLHLLRALDRSRFTPEVVVLEDGPFVEELKRSGTETHVVRAGRVREASKAWKVIAALVELIRSQKIELVHNHNSKAHIYGSLAAAFSGIPAVFHLHGVPRFALTRNGLVGLLSVALPARRTVACSGYSAAAFKAAWHSIRPVRVIHNGVPLVPASSHQADSVREWWGIGRNAPLVVTVGRLQRGKGIHVFLDAAAHVLQSRPDVRFLVVGGTLFGLEEKYADQLRKQVAALNLGMAIQFTGHQADVAAFYRTADVVVHSSLEPEAFGMVLIEAMSYARAVITTGAGGTAEIIRDGVTGLLTPPGDSDSLARAIIDLIGNDERRNALGEAAYLRVREHFAARRMAEEMEEVYREIAGPGPRLGARMRGAMDG